MRARSTTVLAAVAVAGAVLLSGCSPSSPTADTDTQGNSPAVTTPGSVIPTSPSATISSSSPSTQSTSPSSQTTILPSDSLSAGAPTSSLPKKASKPVKVNKKFVNRKFGEKGEVLKFVRNFQVSAKLKKKYSILQQSEIVLVDLKVTASSKYYDSFGEDSFTLTGNDGQENAPSTSLVAGAMRAKGYKPLKNAETGKTSTGWAAFFIDPGFTKLTLSYKGLAEHTSNGKTIPAVTVKVRLKG